MASKGNARIILEQPQPIRGGIGYNSGTVDPAIPKYRDYNRGEYQYRKLRHGWTRLVALCKLLDRQQVNWTVEYDLEQEPPVALFSWHT